MLLIGSDIVGRIFGYPVPGTYEIGFPDGRIDCRSGFARYLEDEGHVSTDFPLEKLSERSRLLLTVSTRFIGIVLFLLAVGQCHDGFFFRLKGVGRSDRCAGIPFLYAPMRSGEHFSTNSGFTFEIMETVHPSLNGECEYERGADRLYCLFLLLALFLTNRARVAMTFIDL